MNRILFAGLCIALAGVARAEAPKPAAACIDPHKSYIARPVNQHDIHVVQSIGKAKPPVRLKTSCINLEPAINIGLNSQFTCIGLGDDVAAGLADGHREVCKVTRVQPYAPEEGDTKQY